MPELLTPEVCAWMMSARSVDQSLPDLSEFLGRPEWQQQAACAGVGTELFVPSLGAGNGAKARALCAECAVRAECLDYALADADLAGIWAGTSVRERVKLRRSVA